MSTKNKSALGEKLTEILRIREEYNYQRFLKYFDEICIVDESNKWIGVKFHKKDNFIFSMKKETDSFQNPSINPKENQTAD